MRKLSLQQFGELERPQSLRLVSSRAFPSGVLELVYERTPGT
jgi:hypothetical protein